MQFTRVLARQVRGRDEPGLQEPDDEGARPGEGIEDVHPLIGHAAPEVLARQPVDAAQNEVDDLHRRVDDAQGLRRCGEGLLEELLVQLGDDPLLALSIVDTGAALTHRGVETVEFVGLSVEVRVIQDGKHVTHDLRHRILGTEVVAIEHGVEDRLGDQVLGEHVDGRVLRNRVIEVRSQGRQELLEVTCDRRVSHPELETGAVTLRDLVDVLGPLLPVAARTHLLHEPRVDRVLPAPQGVKVKAHLDAPPRSTAAHVVVLPAGFAARREGVDDGNLVRLGPVEVDLIDHGIEALVVGAQRLKNFPHDPEDVVVRQDLFRRHARRDRHWQDDVAVLLARSQAHDTPHGLDDVDLRLARGQEHDRVQRRDVHTLAQAAGVRQDPARRRAVLRHLVRTL